MLIYYVIIYFVFVIIIFALATLYFYFSSQYAGCSTQPNFFCYNSWYCPNDSVWGNSGVTGMASSMFGPTSEAAYLCGYSAPGDTGNTCFCSWEGVVNLEAGCGVTFVASN